MAGRVLRQRLQHGSIKVSKQSGARGFGAMDARHAMARGQLPATRSNVLFLQLSAHTGLIPSDVDWQPRPRPGRARLFVGSMCVCK